MKKTLSSVVSFATILIISTALAWAQTPNKFFSVKKIYKAKTDFKNISIENGEKLSGYKVTNCTIEKVEKMKWEGFEFGRFKTLKDEFYPTDLTFKEKLKERVSNISEHQIEFISDYSKYALVLKRKTKIQITEIESIDNQTKYYFIPIGDTSKCHGVVKNNLYSFSSEDHPERYFNEWHSVSHGTLIVPFKIRERNWTLTGDATIGYYVGYNYVIPLLDLHIIPLLSFGLSTVTVPMSDDTTEDKTGITGAGGIVLKHGSDFQIGIIAGMDHLGGPEGDDFEYEDNLWLSIMIGFDFAN